VSSKKNNNLASELLGRMRESEFNMPEALPEPQQKPKRMAISDYLHSFVNKDEFLESKRFQRFLGKTKESLDEFIKTRFSSKRGNIKKTRKDYPLQNGGEPLMRIIADGILFKIAYCYTMKKGSYVLSDVIYEEQFITSLYECMFSPTEQYMSAMIKEVIKQKKAESTETKGLEEFVKDLILSGDELVDAMPAFATIFDYFDYPDTKKWDLIPTYHEIFYYACTQSVLSLIKRKILLDPNVTPDNYVIMCKPESDEEKFSLILDIAEKIERETDNVLLSIILPEIDSKIAKSIEKTKEKDDRDREAELKRAKKEKEEAETEYMRLKHEAERYRKEIESLKRAQKEHNKEIGSINAGFRSEIDRLRKEISDITEEYDKLSEYVEELEEEEEETAGEIITIPDEIRLKRYMFVCEKGKEGYMFLEKIKETFPNSFIRFGSVDVNAAATDGMILLTKYLKHGTYWAMRDRGKEKGIPVLHCNKSSINGIIEVVMNKSKYKEI